MQQTAVEWLVEEFKEKLTGNNLPNWVLHILTRIKTTWERCYTLNQNMMELNEQ